MMPTIFNEMQHRSTHAVVLAMLLVSLLIGAQLHCCAFPSVPAQDCHVCPICSVAAMAIVTPAISVETVTAGNRLEIIRFVLVISAFVPRGIAPRAPPSL